MRRPTRPGRAGRALGMLLALSLAFAVLLAGPASAARPKERRMLRLINQERVQRGRDRLVMREYLVRNARRHSIDMAEAGHWYHNDNLLGQLWNHAWTTIAENVGYCPTVQRMHDWFMGSPPHRQNLLDPDFERVGIGIVRRDGSLWFTEVFTG
jgi:uncharacterized protein YkwD